MRPLRLDLENFLSYREATTIDLSDVGAAVIVGQNGAGKTSIVEAMAWALFGRGRGRGPDDFVSAGATVCRVTFEFEQSAVRYRVERQREIGKAPKSYLGLFAHADPAGIARPGHEYLPCGGDSIADTQAKIEALVGVDADTWLATSFVAQNDAARFTAMRPAERKDLLADMLQLGVHEQMAEASKLHERELAGEVGALVQQREALMAIADDEPERRAAYDIAVARQRAAEEALASAEQAHSDARASLGTARDAVGAFERTEQRLAELRGTRQAAFERVVQAIDRAEQAADRAAGEVRRREDRVEYLHASAGLVEGLERDATAHTNHVHGLQEQLEAESRAASDAEASMRHLVEEAERIDVETIEIRKREELLRREGACYVCEQPVSGETRERLINSLARRQSELAHEQALNNKHQRERRDDVGQRRRAVEHARSGLARGRDAAERTLLAADKARADAEQLAAEQVLVIEAHHALDDADDHLSGLRAEREGLLEPTEEELTLAAQADDIASVRTRLAEAERAEAFAAGDVAIARSTATGNAQLVGSADARLQECSAARWQHGVLLERSGAIIRRRETYSLASQALGRDGIPALIVENTLPEIEAEANRLLELLSDGRFSVRIESLRAKKTGGLRETLDIEVLDVTDGTDRPVHELSGGERQSLDLALRIGLARVLASRRGRPMETLILDEVFTALDAGRRQRAVEVLHTLSGEFPTLLVISHLAELAEAFPIRMLVYKDDAGSHVQTEVA